MASTVRDLQKALLDGQVSLARLLGKTSLVAAKLDLDGVKEWVDMELAGFAENGTLPKYRKVFTSRLEVYNAHREVWQLAGDLSYALEAGQPISEVEAFSQRECIDFPVSKNFSIKNYLGDSFGTDWPQRFVVLGSEYKRIIGAVAERWKTALESRGLTVIDVERFAAFLDAL
jgi:hypothetical protein